MAKKYEQAEMGEENSKSVKNDDMGHDVAKAGYHREDFGPMEEMNYMIEDGYVAKDESPSRADDGEVAEIVKNYKQLYSEHKDGSEESNPRAGKKA